MNKPLTAAHRNRGAAATYNAVAKIMCTILPIQCSQRYNRKWGIEDFIHGIAAMCSYNTYAESAMKALAAGLGRDVPSGRWIRDRVRSVPEQRMFAALSDGIDMTVAQLKKTGMLRGPATVAIDKHLIPRYDKRPDPYLVGSKPKDGTTLFEGYCTVQSVDESCRAQLGAVPVKSGDSLVSMVRKLLSNCARNGIRLRCVLLDREFFSTGVIHEIKRMHRTFLMPAKKTAGIKNAILEHVEGKRGAISPYTLRTQSGYSETFTLVIVPRPNTRGSNIEDQYLAFATNLAPGKIYANIRAIPDEYRRRWGIETGYACVGRLRARTTSPNHSMRMLCFVYPMILFNCWIIANCILREGLGGKPVMSIVVLKILMDMIILEWFGRSKLDYYLECVS